QQEPASTEGSLRALLNKLAPSSNSLGSLANQVAGHLLEDEAPHELARQLVDRVQLESMYAATYAKLCSVLVRVRSGFVFYKQLMTRCKEAFGQGVRTLIVEPMELDDDSGSVFIVPHTTNVRDAPIGDHRSPQFHEPLVQSGPQHHQQQPLLYSRSTISPYSNGAGFGPQSTPPNSSAAIGFPNDDYPSGVDVQRHRLRALVVFLCQLFVEGLLSFDRLYDDYLKLLEVHLPEDDVAVECICSALTCAGQAIERAHQSWVLTTVRQLQAALRPPHEQRQLRMIFMMQDLVEMHQRNWQPRELTALTSASRMPRDQAEPSEKRLNSKPPQGLRRQSPALFDSVAKTSEVPLLFEGEGRRGGELEAQNAATIVEWC
ncbi:eukaryotic initiation factor iso-4F subunit p82-34-like, partial [Tropilaelaps mercedesae]